MENNEFFENSASVENEPKQNFHFRYESEIKQGNTHGILSGQKGDYPKIKLFLPENGQKDEWGNERDFFVLCSLHCFANNKPLSPHLLMPKNETEINYKFIFEKMETCEGNPVKRVWELKDYVIVRLKNMEFKNSLENKQREFGNLNYLPLNFERILGQLKLNDSRSVKDSGKLNVCLGFTIFEKNFYDNTYSLYRDTIYSCNIYHGDDLRIHDLCNTKGSIQGGTKISILIRLESNLPLNVLIKKIDEVTKKTVWSKEVPILDSKKFQNAAISFFLPRYEGPCTDEAEIEVNMCVIVRNTTYKSDNVKFYYINEKSCKRTRNEGYYDNLAEYQGKKSKRAMAYVSCDSNDSLSGLSRSQNDRSKNDIKYQINILFNEITDNYVNYEFMDSVLYDALESPDTLIHLYKKARSTNKQDIIVNFRNDNGENLLHWACKMNHFKSIRPLIGLGCHINEQDYWGRTPLHLAISAPNHESILEIQTIFKNYKRYSNDLEADLVKMLKAYNHNNYTVVHEAVLNGYNELLEILLTFMQEHALNVLDYEVLGSGDSIVHLAAMFNTLTSIESLIGKYIPNYMSVKNYAGVTPKDLKDEFSKKLCI